MHRILISGAWVCRLLTVCVLSGAVHSARAQQSWAAYVTADNAPVYADMTTSSNVLTWLHKGDSVAVLFALQTSQGSWCKITVQSDRQDFGFVLCSQIHRGHAPSPSGGASSATGATGAPVRECKELVEELMEATGLKSGLSVVSTGFFDGFNAGFRNLGREERAEVLAIVKREFDASVLDAGVRRGLLNRCDSQTYAAAFDALQAPLAIKIRKIEVESASPAKATERLSYAARLRDNPPPPERVALLQRVGRESGGGTEFGIDLVVDIGVIFISDLAGQTPTQAQIDSLREQIAPHIRQSFLLLSLVIYRSVSDQDLRQYISLWESQPLQEFSDNYRGVFQEVMETQSRTAAAELKANIEARRSRSTSPR
jgi:hypothetical protein